MVCLTHMSWLKCHFNECSVSCNSSGRQSPPPSNLPLPLLPSLLPLYFLPLSTLPSSSTIFLSSLSYPPFLLYHLSLLQLGFSLCSKSRRMRLKFLPFSGWTSWWMTSGLKYPRMSVKCESLKELISSPGPMTLFSGWFGRTKNGEDLCTLTMLIMSCERMGSGVRIQITYCTSSLSDVMWTYGEWGPYSNNILYFIIEWCHVNIWGVGYGDAWPLLEAQFNLRMD